MSWSASITRFTKHGGNLSKSISLGPDGKLVNNANGCRMVEGTAERITIEGLQQFRKLIADLAPHQAIALGELLCGTPSPINVVTADRLHQVNGAAVIARTQSFIHFDHHPGFALIDYDQKGMPVAISQELQRLGGFERALVFVLPELADAGTVIRSSTSVGLYRTDTNQHFPHSGGRHLYVQIADVSDSERFLTVLHRRCWLAGLGWMMLGEAGQFLERSLVDRSVGQPERLVFEGAPALTPPLTQNLCVREPIVREGKVLDTSCCADLSIVETAQFQQLLFAEKQRLNPEADKKRAAFVEKHAKEIARRSGVSIEQARRTVERQIGGLLTPSVVLPFDDPELAGKTVADVLADPERFLNCTLADPIEGVAYGHCKAKVMQGGGRPFIHSLAHGTSTIYRLGHDFASAKERIDGSSKEDAAAAFVELVLADNFEVDEIELLSETAAKRCGLTKTVLKNKLKAERQKQNRRRAEAERERQLAERTDPRPQIEVPDKDAEWLPVMDVINDVLAASKAAEPPVRGIERVCTEGRTIVVPRLSQLSIGANRDD